MMNPLSSSPLSGVEVTLVSAPASVGPTPPVVAPPHAAARESVPLPKATSAARDRRTDGATGRGEARNDASSVTPQKGQAASDTRMWRAHPVHARRWDLVMGELRSRLRLGTERPRARSRTRRDRTAPPAPA